MSNIMIGTIAKSRKDVLFYKKQIIIEKKMLSEVRRKLRMPENKHPYSQSILKDQAKLLLSSIKKLNKKI